MSDFIGFYRILAIFVSVRTFHRGRSAAIHDISLSGDEVRLFGNEEFDERRDVRSEAFFTEEVGLAFVNVRISFAGTRNHAGNDRVYVDFVLSDFFRERLYKTENAAIA